jgi:hypothetical protein
MNFEELFYGGVLSGKNSFVMEAIRKQEEFNNLSEHDKKLYKLASEVSKYVLYPFNYVFMRIQYIDRVKPSILKKKPKDIVRYV